MILSIEDRSKALSAALQNVEKRFGTGAIMRLGETRNVAVETISTGSLAIDGALGVGGLPRGRVVEIYGPEASGKTTLTLQLIAQAQASGGTAAFIDAEHALDVTYAGRLGVDVDALLVAQPDSGEQALEITETLVRSGAVDLVVVDSVAALVPQAEIEGEMGDTHVGLQARLMSQALRKLTAIAARSRTMVVFINQVRHKIGITFGNGEVTTGGNALKFYSSVRIEIRRIGSITEGENVVGNRTKVKIVKNKLAPPFRTLEVEILYGRGICQAGELITIGERLGLITRSGAWYTLDEEKFQGKEKLREHLLEQPDHADALRARVVALLAPEVAVAQAK